LESPPIKAFENLRKSGFVQISVAEGLSKSKVLAGDKRIIIQINLIVLKTESSRESIDYFHFFYDVVKYRFIKFRSMLPLSQNIFF
jgi:hypothetical protein